MNVTRREAMKTAASLAAATAVWPAMGEHAVDEKLYRVSLAQWSLHKLLFGGEITNLEFAAEARELGFDAIEYVSQFFKDQARDDIYLMQLNSRAQDAGVRQLLIMVDGEGDLGHPSDAERARSVENHRKWLDAARALGCHSIRVNAASQGSWEEQQRLAADGLRRLCEHAEPYRLNVIVENHGGLSSNGAWLAGVMKLVDHELVGTLPDFGNFCMDWSRADDPEAWYDRYQGVRELMPFAKAVSAKSHEFSASGDEVRTDYRKMLKIVVDAGYRGWIGVEYEGSAHEPRAGSVLTRELLERVRDELA